MSGVPNVSDISKLRAALAEVAKENESIEKAERDLAHCELRIQQAAQRRDSAERQVRELMAAMDCHAPGNAGYHQRLFSLLSGLAREAEQHGRSHP